MAKPIQVGYTVYKTLTGRKQRLSKAEMKRRTELAIYRAEMEYIDSRIGGK